MCGVTVLSKRKRLIKKVKLGVKEGEQRGQKEITKETRSVPNPRFIGRWISGEPMAREREINPQYQKIIQNNNTKRSSSYTKQRCGLSFFFFFFHLLFSYCPKTQE